MTSWSEIKKTYFVSMRLQKFWNLHDVYFLDVFLQGKVKRSNERLTVICKV